MKDLSKKIEFAYLAILGRLLNLGYDFMKSIFRPSGVKITQANVTVDTNTKVNVLQDIPLAPQRPTTSLWKPNVS